MSDLGSLIGNGRYVFFKSLANSPLPWQREAYAIGNSRINAVNGALSGKNLDGSVIAEASPEMQIFSNMMDSYLSKL